MWEPTNRNQAKKCREVQRRVGKFLGSSSVSPIYHERFHTCKITSHTFQIVRLGGNVTTKIQSNASYPTQRKYPGKGTTIGSSSIITERSTVTADCKVKSRTQREYPHGRKLGYSNVSLHIYFRIYIIKHFDLIILIYVLYFNPAGEDW